MARYRLTALKYPKGHGFRVHHATSKKGAEALAKKIGGKTRIAKIQKR